MDTGNDPHPIMAGISIGRRARTDTEVLVGATLTGMATRISDKKLVLVTNAHVMGRVPIFGYIPELNSNDVMTQPDYIPGSDRVIASIDQLTYQHQPYLDLATSVVEGDILPLFQLHTDDHEEGLILAGTVEPKVGDTVTITGGERGTRTATVLQVDETVTTTATIRGGSAFRTVQLDLSGVVVLDASPQPAGPGDSGGPCLVRDPSGPYRMTAIIFGGTSARDIWAFPASRAESAFGISFGMSLPDKAEVLATRNRLGEVIRRLTVPIKEIPASDSPSDPVDAGMSRCSLTYAPPITFVREGTWAKGTWESTGPGGVGYYPVKLSKDAQIVGTEFEWPQFPYGIPVPPPPLREDGVVMDSPVVAAPIDNGDGTFF